MKRKNWTKALKYKLLCNCWTIRFFLFSISTKKLEYLFVFKFNFYMMRFYERTHYTHTFCWSGANERGCIWLGDRSNLNRNRPFQWKTFPVFICLCVCATLCHLRHSTMLKSTHHHIKYTHTNCLCMWTTKCNIIKTENCHWQTSRKLLKDFMRERESTKYYFYEVAKVKLLSLSHPSRSVSMCVCVCVCVKQCGKQNIRLRRTTILCRIYARAIKTEIAT